MCRELDDYDTRELVDEIIRRGASYRGAADDVIENLLTHSDLSPHLRRWIQLDLDSYFSAKTITQADLDHYLKSIEVSGGSS